MTITQPKKGKLLLAPNEGCQKLHDIF